MSIINQMLRDLEKSRSQGVINSGQGAMNSPEGGMNDPSGIVCNILPATSTKRGSHRPALWTWPLLIIGLTAAALVLRPSLLEGMSMTSLASMMPDAAAMPGQTIPTRAMSHRTLQSSPVPPPPSLVTPEPGNIATVSIVLPQVASQPITATPALPPSSAPAPAIVAPLNLISLPSGAWEKAPQRITPASPTQLPDHRLHTFPQETVHAPVLNKHIKEIPPSQQAENEYRKAVELLQQGQMTRAIESLAQALHLDNSHVAARQTLVSLLVEEKRLDEAEQLLQEGLKVGVGLDANRPGLAMMLARLQVERGDTRTGLDTLQRNLPDVQDNAVEYADYQAFLAALLQREGQHGKAIEHYLQALRKIPQSGIWLMGIGISLQAENRWQEAQEAFQRAKASNTLNPDLQAFIEQRLKQIQR